ncbi:GMC oxidoreductase [Pandoraea bronchicola]|uniref:GMC oxidoreductase n=1 Tax=Pandoraea bronchicola TaxID=2508287 RepID=UPI0012415CF3|nr:GMC oxidoreductase [Pandoraea bronchicola]
MGDDPAQFVCDKWGRAHDHENLFFASTGVLSTAGTCNSTGNGVALVCSACSGTMRGLVEVKVT